MSRHMAVGVLCWAFGAGLSAHASGLPVSSVRLLQGRVTLHPADGGTEFALTVRSDADVAVEKMALQIGCAEAAARGAAGSAYRWHYFDPPLEPGQRRRIVFVDDTACIQPTVEIVDVRPALRAEINGRAVSVDPSVFMWKGEVFGPLGEIARRLGMDVTWCEPWQTAAFIADGHVLVLMAGSEHIVYDGDLRQLDSGLRTERGNLIGPIAQVIGLMGATVRYDRADNVIRISYEGALEGSDGRGQSEKTARE